MRLKRSGSGGIMGLFVDSYIVTLPHTTLSMGAPQKGRGVGPDATSAYHMGRATYMMVR